VAVCGCVWLCVAVCGCVWLCVAVCGCVWLCVAVCGCVWLCVAYVNLSLLACSHHGGRFGPRLTSIVGHVLLLGGFALFANSYLDYFVPAYLIIGQCM
jgi:hypothetical protein